MVLSIRTNQPFTTRKPLRLSRPKNERFEAIDEMLKENKIVIKTQKNGEVVASLLPRSKKGK